METRHETLLVIAFNWHQSAAFWVSESFFSLLKSQTFSSFVVDWQGVSLHTLVCECYHSHSKSNQKKVVFKLQQGRLTTFFRLRFFIFVCSSFKRNSIKLRVSFLVRIVLLTTNDYAWAKIVFRSLTRTNLVLLNDSSNSLARESRVRYAWTFQDDLFVLRFKPLWKCQQSVDCIRTVSLIIHSPRSFKSQLAWKKFNETTSMFADSDRVYYCLREFRYLSRHPQTSFLCFLGQPFRFHSTTPVDSSFAIKPRTTRRILRFRWMFLSLRLPVKS